MIKENNCMDYSPKQITTFREFPSVVYRQIDYRGIYKEDIEYLWTLESTEKVQNFKYLIIPDGCIDIISDIENQNNIKVLVSKPFEKATCVSFPEKFKYWGIRIKPGKSLRFLNFFPSEIKEDFQDIILNEEEIIKLNNHSDDIHIYSETLLNLIFNKPKPEVINRLISELDLTMDLNNVSPRHARRLFKLITGFSRKSFEKIIKINRNISNSKDYYKDYFDQSHFIKTFKTATGLTPKDFFKKYRI